MRGVHRRPRRVPQTGAQRRESLPVAGDGTRPRPVGDIGVRRDGTRLISGGDRDGTRFARGLARDSTLARRIAPDGTVAIHRPGRHRLGMVKLSLVAVFARVSSSISV